MRGIWTQYDLTLRQLLIDRGEWQGPGNIIGLVPGQELEDSRGVLLHEVSHALPLRQPPREYDPTPQQMAVHLKLTALVDSIADQQRQLKPWDQHEADFIRRCVHLRYRAQRLGVELPYPAIRFAGYGYSLSSAIEYARSLGDEPHRMAGCSFREIEATPAPEAFTKLFDNDVASWQRHLTFNQQEQELCQPSLS
jgi:hypothetical protein